MAEISQENKQKIDILLKEYDTLRSEIISRTASGFNLVAALGIFGTWLSQHELDGWHLGIVVAYGILAIGIAIVVFAALGQCGRQVARIEKRINLLAGDELLEWESLWGMSTQGITRSLKKRQNENNRWSPATRAFRSILRSLRDSARRISRR